MLIEFIASGLIYLSIVAAYSASNNTLSRREIPASKLVDVRGGLLFKNSKQTSCEVGLISMKAGFIAATCFDFTAGTSIDRSVKYEIYLQDGSSTPLVVPLDPSDIHIHPNYKPSTLQNNLAVIEFNKDTKDTYKTYVIADMFMANNNTYVRRTINPSTGKWNDNASAAMPDKPKECVYYSGLAAANDLMIACTNLTTSSIYNPSCAVPYGTIYMQGDDGIISLVAVHSFTVANGPSLCKGGTLVYTYFIELWGLDQFATSVLGYPIDVMVNYKPTTEQGTAIFSNNFPGPDIITDKTVLTGDIYARETAIDNNKKDDDSANTSATDNSRKEDDGSSSIFTETTDSNGSDISAKETNKSLSTESTDNSKDGLDQISNEPNNSGSGGLKKTQIIIIAIVVPVVSLLLAFLIYILFRIWISKRSEKPWDPLAETNHHREAIFDLGGLDIDDATPPPYTRRSTSSESLNIRSNRVSRQSKIMKKE
ncbi:hypothetical protein J3B02_000459 [Coemansia erecta]|nr:hypothetical protein J3B02_000459 [Coemansia erecta]KAJ2877491.1 hypothetical protein FB639_003732 [Coemansia asiatica]